MKFFSTHPARRASAFVVLLVWLFALAAGVANACLLQVSAPRYGGGDTAVAAAVQVPTRLTDHAHASAGHNDGYSDGSGTFHAACLTVSDDGSRLAPRAFSGIGYTDPGPSPVTAVRWSTVMAVLATPHRIEHLAPRVSGLPIQLRFARLAL